jgi:hypothetical protein
MTARHRTTMSDGGFVLIGVVVFVLALTILVLSLYGLSSYEAQFLQRSLDEEQAFQSAVGGIERAKFALSLPPYELESVAQNLPEGVDSTVAIQDGNSTGPVTWGGTNVMIRVTAKVNGAQRAVDGQFTPMVTQNYYSPLLTVSEGIEVETVSLDHGYENRSQTVLLDGPVWESSPQDTNSWKPLLYPPAPLGIRKSPAVPVPSVAPFLTQHPGPFDLAELPVVSGPASNRIYLLGAGSGGTVGYFSTPDNSDPSFSLRLFPYGCQVQVQGLAVWLMPRGIYVFEPVLINGDPTKDCLVIIAGPEGITFWGGLQASIPVILVSNGQVILFHGENRSSSSSTVDLSIFARSAKFMGPVAPAVLPLLRNPNGPLNTFFLDALAAQGALPNVTSVSGRRLVLVPGSWHASGR